VTPATRRDCVCLFACLLLTSLYVLLLPALISFLLHILHILHSKPQILMMAEGSSSETARLLGPSPPPSSSPEASIADSDAGSQVTADLEQSVPREIVTGSFRFGGDATHDEDRAMVKTTSEDFWKWCGSVWLVKMFGRTKFQILCSSFFFVAFLVMLFFRNSKQQLACNVLGLCFSLLFLSNNSVTNHELVCHYGTLPKVLLAIITH